MAGSNQSKIRILQTWKILKEQTDENNPITMPQLIEELGKAAIAADRRAVYDDIKVLQDFGLDICEVNGKSYGYFLGGRDFETAELRLIIDSILSAKILSEKKSKQLIEKVAKLASKNVAKSLESQVHVEDRVKCCNEEVYYNVDKLHAAINNNRMVSFKYFYYDLDKQRVFRHSGYRYLVSPYAMTWNDDKYYLIGNYHKYDDLSHYRIDRMCNIEIMGQPSRSFSELSKYKDYFNIGDYYNKTFNMYVGTEEEVEIKFENRFINDVIDKFGIDVPIVKEAATHFRVAIKAMVSDGFISWLFRFGSGMEVISPMNLRERVCKFAEEVSKVHSIKRHKKAAGG